MDSSFNFDRTYEFIAGIPSRPGFSTNSLRILFSIEKYTTESPGTGKITLYNLSPASIATLNLKDCAVQLRAGYGTRNGLIFAGNIVNIVTKKEGADTSTEIEAVESRVTLRDTYVSLSYSGKINRKKIAQDIADTMGVALTIGPSAVFEDYPLGFSYIGLAAAALRKICQADGLAWTLQNGILQITKANQPINERVYLLSPDTGLISIPESIIKGDRITSTGNLNNINVTKIATKKESLENAQKGWKINYLLNPAIGINDYVRVESQLVKGYFRVNKLTVTGDSWGSGEDSWRCEAEVLEAR